MIDMEMSTLEIALMAVMIGGGVINRDCVITFINKRDVYLSGSSRYFLIKILNSNYEQRLKGVFAKCCRCLAPRST